MSTDDLSDLSSDSSAGFAVVAALEDDPFYRNLCGGAVQVAASRRAILTRYFAYSIQEGREIGRCVCPDDRAPSVVVWLLPQPPDIQAPVSGGGAQCGGLRELLAHGPVHERGAVSVVPESA